MSQEDSIMADIINDGSRHVDITYTQEEAEAYTGEEDASERWGEDTDEPIVADPKGKNKVVEGKKKVGGGG
jgi:hypothetical protein